MHVFITGAATGIGEATVESLHRKYHSAGFTIVDKNQQALQDVCQRLTVRGIRAHGIACDLTDIDGLPDVVRRAQADMGDIELLVNNAGVMLVEDFSRMSWEKGMLQMNLNTIAPLRLIHSILPGMLERGRGGIINIASMAARSRARAAASHRSINPAKYRRSLSVMAPPVFCGSSVMERA